MKVHKDAMIGKMKSKFDINSYYTARLRKAVHALPALRKRLDAYHGSCFREFASYRI